MTGLIIPAPVLAEGGEATAGFILHEAAHILCWTRGITEVTVRGVYHNADFLSAAEEVGLTWPEGRERTQRRGFTTTDLSDETRTNLRASVAEVDEAIPRVLSHLTVAAPPRQREGRVSLTCECDPPRTVRIATLQAERGWIKCGACGSRFT
ncbi:hypothetical protein ACH4OV_25280 [Streptomyces diastaticus]|uniref:hypothetical protein n=1 Tax=Streptomyces diastaticus TaxID=1956 RepID=UPI0037B98D45